jgi:SAM-dependent methyltransferase
MAAAFAWAARPRIFGLMETKTSLPPTEPRAVPACDAESRGLPSMVWRAGQTRRFEMIRRVVALDGARVLDIGCGVGAYTAEMASAGAEAYGTEVELERAREAAQRGHAVLGSAAEALPFSDGSFDAVLLHEVLEHVADDRLAAREVTRVLRAGGRAVIFVPNRWWPFETHGVVWRGRYHFGNAPLVNYLPDPARNRLAPHVRTYTGSSLRELFLGLPVDVILHTQVFPGFDKLATRRPRLAGFARRAAYAIERSPARLFGLSHLLVVERQGGPFG